MFVIQYKFRILRHQTMIRISEKNTPRWIIFLIDLTICICSFLLAYLVRFNFRIPEIEISRWIYALPTLLIVRMGSFLITRVYQGIIRYTSTRDALRVFYTITSGSLFMAIANLVAYPFTHIFLVPFSIIIIDYFTSVFTLTAFRILVKTIYMRFKTRRARKNQLSFMEPAKLV